MIFNNHLSSKQINFSQVINNTPVILLSFLLFALPLIYFDNIRDYSSLPRYAFYGVLSGLILVLSLFTNSKNNKNLLPNYFVGFILLFLAWAWLSSLWALDPKNAQTELLQLTASILICISSILITQRYNILLPLYASVTACFAVSIIGIAQYYNINPFNYKQFFIPSSTFTNPNFAAIYIDLVFPFSFVLIFIAKNKYLKWFLSTNFSISLIFLYLLHSRGSLLGLLVASLIFLFLLYKNKSIQILFFQEFKKNIILIILPLIVSLIFFSFFSFLSATHITQQNAIHKTTSVTPQKRTSSFQFDSSAKIRLNAYINAFDLIIDNPLTGVGIGSFKTGFRHYMFSTVPILEADEDMTLMRLHNDPLQFFVELGLFGGILYLLIFFVTIKSSWQLLTVNAENNESTIIQLGVIFALLASGVHSLVDFPLHKPTSAVQFWFTIGLVYGQSIKYHLIPVINIKASVSKVISLFCILFLVYNYSFYSNYIRASHARLSLSHNKIPNDCKDALTTAKKMLTLFSADFSHQTAYVNTLARCEKNSANLINAMSSILKLDPSNTRALITRATAYLKINMPLKAKDDFSQVIKILPHRASGYIGLTYVALQLGNLSAAKLLILRALKLEPNNKIAENLFQKINLYK